jgi:ribosomal protein S27AE
MSGRRQVEDNAAAGMLRTWYGTLPVPPLRPAQVWCPRCGSKRIADYGAQVICGHCGATWQADALLVEPGRPTEPPPDPGRRSAARRRLDEAAQR